MTIHQEIRTDGRKTFYDKLAPVSLAPLWEVMKDLVPPEPRNKALAHAWSYPEVRALLTESVKLLTTEEAKRRVLVFENPALIGQSRVNASVRAYNSFSQARPRPRISTPPAPSASFWKATAAIPRSTAKNVQWRAATWSSRRAARFMSTATTEPAR